MKEKEKGKRGGGEEDDENDSDDDYDKELLRLPPDSGACVQNVPSPLP